MCRNLDGFAPGAKIVHVDIDPGAIGNAVPVDLPLIGNAGDILAQMVDLCDEKKLPKK
jgi:acetolactate synthase-1/2/3 large subunit